MKDKIAGLISNIINPFIITIIVLVLIALKASTDNAHAIRWIFITVAISVFPVFIFVLFLLHFKKLDGIFNNSRQQRTKVYLIAAFLGAIDCLVLWYFKVPDLLLETFYAGLIAVVIFTIINRYWKISLHTAFVTAGVAMLIMIYGINMAWGLMLFPLVGWSRIALRQHSFAQVVIGGVLAVVIVIGVYCLFSYTR
jgi:membrane-associated phospholipid phosphatase